MNDDIIPYVFENHTVRTITDDAGNPLFCGKDIAVALGYENPNEALKYHCKGVAKRYPLATKGGIQAIRFITEADMFRLIVGSKLESAQRFERWVFEEVLPSIRKTGSYQSQQPAPVALPTMPILTIADWAIAKMSSVTGVQPGIAMAAALTCIQEHTGIDLEPFRKVLPAPEPRCSLNATKVGKLLGVSAMEANMALTAHGLQVRNERGELELTEEGKELGEVFPFARNGHSGYQILWSDEVIQAISG